MHFSNVPEKHIHFCSGLYFKNYRFQLLSAGYKITTHWFGIVHIPIFASLTSSILLACGGVWVEKNNQHEFGQSSRNKLNSFFPPVSTKGSCADSQYDNMQIGLVCTLPGQNVLIHHYQLPALSCCLIFLHLALRLL